MVYVKNIARKSGKRSRGRPSMRGSLRALFNASHGICSYCRRKTSMPSILPGARHDLMATVDHVTPLSRGGAMRGDNLALACSRCNGLKGDKTLEEWTLFMIDNPEWWLRRRRGELKTQEGLFP